LRGAQLGPTIASLQGHLEELRVAEIERFRGKLGGLTPEQEQAVEALTRGILNKVAHQPITEMKRMAGHPDGSRYVEFVRRTFNLRRS
jgi:glutamyl-tRNA reductase